MDKEWIKSQILVGRDHEAVVDRRYLEALPGLFSEVRIRKAWRVDFEVMARLHDDSGPVWTANGESLEGAIALVEKLLACSLADCDPELVVNSTAATDAGIVAAAILDGRVSLPREFELPRWMFSNGSYEGSIGSSRPAL